MMTANTHIFYEVCHKVRNAISFSVDMGQLHHPIPMKKVLNCFHQLHVPMKTSSMLLKKKQGALVVCFKMDISWFIS